MDGFVIFVKVTKFPVIDLAAYGFGAGDGPSFAEEETMRCCSGDCGS
jgi:hypothetical protein